MCNLYSHRKGPAAIIDLFKAMTNEAGNLEPADFYPDYPAPIVRHDGACGLVLAKARCGLTSSRQVILDLFFIHTCRLLRINGCRPR